MYLRVTEEGMIESCNELPDDALQQIDNGAADYIRFNRELDCYERLAAEWNDDNPHEAPRMVWHDID